MIDYLRRISIWIVAGLAFDDDFAYSNDVYLKDLTGVRRSVREEYLG